MHVRETVIMLVLLITICFCSMVATRGNDPLGAMAPAPAAAQAAAPAESGGGAPPEAKPPPRDVVDIYEATIRQVGSDRDLYFVVVDGPYLSAVMRRIADLRNCRPITASTATRAHQRLDAPIADRKTHESGHLIWADAIQWQDATHVRVPCGIDLCYARGGAKEMCTLEKKHDRWIVMDRTLVDIP